jgi:hypothetical protein
MMKQIPNDRSCGGLAPLILNKKHDIDIGGEAEFLPAVPAEGDGCNQLFVGIRKRLVNGADEIVDSLRQCQANVQSAATLAMESDNGLKLRREKLSGGQGHAYPFSLILLTGIACNIQKAGVDSKPGMHRPALARFKAIRIRACLSG